METYNFLLWDLWSNGHEIIIDDIFEYREIEKVWSEVCNKTIGIYKPMIRDNASDVRLKDWREYYDENSYNLVTQLVKKDIDVFGYTFDC